jgi:hypothetical protein
MRRFLQHVLPRGFVKVRHFGLLAPGNVNTKLAQARDAIAPAGPTVFTVESPPAVASDIPTLDWRALFFRLTGVDLGLCPDCGGALVAEPLSDPPFAARAPPLDSS